MRHCFEEQPNRKGKKFILATVLSTVFAVGALAEDNRGHAFGKDDMGAKCPQRITRPREDSRRSLSYRFAEISPSLPNAE